MQARYHGLDLARAVFMLLGVVYHSALVYQSEAQWRVSYGQGARVFDYLQMVIHDFRMPAFYMIAGFFFVLVVDKYGAEKAIKSRLTRLAVPLFAVGLTLNLVMNHLSQREFAEGVNYWLQGEWLGHLWFIGNLIVYSLLFAPLAGLFCHTTEKHSHVWDVALLFLVVPLLSTVLASLAAAVYDGRILFVTTYTLLKFIPYYVFGMYLFSLRGHLKQFFSFGRSCAAALAYLLLTVASRKLDHLLPGDFLLDYIHAVAGGCLAFSAIGALNAVARESRLVSRIVAASYTIYLLHQPLVVVLFYLVEPIPLPPFLSFLLLSSLVFWLSYFCHQQLVLRSALLLFLLNGILPRRPRAGKPAAAVHLDSSTVPEVGKGV